MAAAVAAKIQTIQSLRMICIDVCTYVHTSVYIYSEGGEGASLSYSLPLIDPASMPRVGNVLDQGKEV